MYGGQLATDNIVDTSTWYGHTPALSTNTSEGSENGFRTDARRSKLPTPTRCKNKPIIVYFGVVFNGTMQEQCILLF